MSCAKIQEWTKKNTKIVVDYFCLLVLAVVNLVLDGLHPHRQCIPDKDGPCSRNMDGRDGTLNMPLKDDAVNYTYLLYLSPLIYLSLMICHALCADVRNWNHFFKKFDVVLRTLLLSVFTTLLITQIMKISVGRPRPNFYNYESPESRKSYPSGHASTAFSAYLLLTLYLYYSFHFAYDITKKVHHRSEENDNSDSNSNEMETRNGIDKREIESQSHIPSNSQTSNDIIEITRAKKGHQYFGYTFWYWFHQYHLSTIGLIFVFIPFYFAIYVGCSRITDYKHHPSDVTAGAMLGIGCTIFSFHYYKHEYYDT